MKEKRLCYEELKLIKKFRRLTAGNKARLMGRLEALIEQQENEEIEREAERNASKA